MIRFAPALALALFVPACLDEPADLGSTEEASTLIDMCATSGPNATSSITFGTDSFTRPADRVNPPGTNNCDCKNHQAVVITSGDAVADAMFPNCRAWTVVDFSVGGQQLGYRLGAEVGQWGSVVDKTMCDNSEVFVEVQQFNFATGSYQTIWDPGTLKPFFINGACRGPSVLSPQGVALSGSFRVRAKARRGLLEFNHGFETVTVRGVPAT